MNRKPYGPAGVRCLVVRHDAWCPVLNDGKTCCCRPTTEEVDESTLVEVASRDFRNRAQRRAEARRQRRANGGTPS